MIIDIVAKREDGQVFTVKELRELLDAVDSLEGDVENRLVLVVPGQCPRDVVAPGTGWVAIREMRTYPGEPAKPRTGRDAEGRELR